MARVAIALGSNLGDRDAHLRFAVRRLSQILEGVTVSSFRTTAPVGVTTPQPDYLNAALTADTSLSATAVLLALRAIEDERGRERPHDNAPRTLDLDLILFGGEVVNEPSLVVPHPRFRERRFVLEPLAEIAPEMPDPLSGRTVGELLAALQA